MEQRTALALQLRQALREYYPAAVEALEDWTMPSAWAFVEQFPAPAALAQAGVRSGQNFLHAHKLYRPTTAEKRLEVLFGRVLEFVSPSVSVTTAKSLLATTIVKQLRSLEAQLKGYRRRIEQAYADHPDAGRFDSLPGGGKKLAPRSLGEIGANREVFESIEALQCHAGTAPVTKQSGKSRRVQVRRACNQVLRAGVHDEYIRGEFWTDEARRAYYEVGLIAASTPQPNEPPELSAQRVQAQTEYPEWRARRLLSRLSHRRPDDRVGYSMLAYRLSDAEVGEMTRP